MPRLRLTRKHFPVARLLNALVLACLLPGIVGITLFLLLDYREGRERLSRDNIDAARALGRAIDAHVLRIGERVTLLAEADELRSSSPSTFAARITRTVLAAGLGSHVAVYGNDGRLLSLSTEGSGFLSNLPDAEAARRLGQGGAPSVSDLLSDPVTGHSFILTQVPVRRPGRDAYTVAIAIPSAQLTSALLEHNFPGGWLASVLDRRGVILARNRGAEKYVGQLASATLRDAILKDAAGTVENINKEGIPSFTAFWRSPRTGFTAIVGVPQAQVVGPLRQKLSYLSATVAMLFALGLLLARSVSGLISRSIQALIEPASALGKGTPLAVAPVHVSEAQEVGVAIERAAALLGQRDRALSEQKEELQQFQFFSENSNEMLLLIDQDGRIRYANRMACARLGYSSKELLSTTLFAIAPASTPESLLDTFERCRSAGLPRFERIYRCKDGSDFPVEITATVLQHRGEWLMHVAPRDIGERRQAEQAIRWAASHDPLTGLANRSRVLEVLEQAVALARADGGHGALLYIDLDRFKPVNDLYGHEVGDRVLRVVADRMQGSMHRDQSLARIGGDEFMAVLPCVDAAGDAAVAAAQALLEAVSLPIRVGNIEVKLSACIGISRFPEHGDNAGRLVHTADVAMLQTKQGGRGAYAFYSPEMDARAQFMLSVERRLQHALDNDALVLHYQPIVNLATGELEGVEALVRLADGIEPAVGPAGFIPVAEACGLIVPLGQWVAAQACRQQSAWAEEGLDLWVSVNVSALQFQGARFLDDMRALVARSRIRPDRLVLELTETAIMANLADAVHILRELKTLGVRVALDDFGTGYSSLSSLSALPLDKLKIDQSFVRGIETNPANRAVIDAIIALGKSLDLELVAEGIETEAALHYLQARGCHQGQGYHFSRPLPVSELHPLWGRQASAA